jgi:hypothetical protein
VAIFFTGCSGGAPSVTPQLLLVYSTPTAEAWLAGAYDCAGQAGLVVARSFDASSADIVLRIDEPHVLAGVAYQVGEAEVVVVVSAQNSVSELTLRQAADLFSGRVSDWSQVGGAGGAVHVWVFGAQDDLQQAFDGEVLGGAATSSMARQAVSVEQMRAAITADPAAVGLLIRPDVGDGLRPVLSAVTLPVLAILPEEPQGALATVLACMQK